MHLYPPPPHDVYNIIWHGHVAVLAKWMKIHRWVDFYFYSNHLNSSPFSFILNPRFWSKKSNKSVVCYDVCFVDRKSIRFYITATIRGHQHQPTRVLWWIKTHLFTNVLLLCVPFPRRPHVIYCKETKIKEKRVDYMAGKRTFWTLFASYNCCGRGYIMASGGAAHL